MGGNYFNTLFYNVGVELQITVREPKKKAIKHLQIQRFLTYFSMAGLQYFLRAWECFAPHGVEKNINSHNLLELSTHFNSPQHPTEIEGVQ